MNLSGLRADVAKSLQSDVKAMKTAENPLFKILNDMCNGSAKVEVDFNKANILAEDVAKNLDKTV